MIKDKDSRKKERYKSRVRPTKVTLQTKDSRWFNIK